MMRLGSGLGGERSTSVKLDSSLAMVNIVLLLIFFFIASGTIRASQDEVTTQLPLTSKLTLTQLPQPLLEIRSDGMMLLDGQLVERGSLAAATLDHPVLHVVADRESNAIAILQVLEAENLVAVELRLVTIHQRGEEES